MKNEVWTCKYVRCFHFAENETLIKQEKCFGQGEHCSTLCTHTHTQLLHTQNTWRHRCVDWADHNVSTNVAKTTAEPINTSDFSQPLAAIYSTIKWKIGIYIKVIYINSSYTSILIWTAFLDQILEEVISRVRMLLEKGIDFDYLLSGFVVWDSASFNSNHNYTHNPPITPL